MPETPLLRILSLTNMRFFIAVLFAVFVNQAKAQNYTIYTIPYHITSPGTYTLGQDFSQIYLVTPPLIAIHISSSHVYLSFAGHTITSAQQGTTGVEVDPKDARTGQTLEDVNITGGSVSFFSIPLQLNGNSTWVSKMSLHIWGYGQGITEEGNGIVVSGSSISGDNSSGQIGIVNEGNNNANGFIYFGGLDNGDIYINSNNPSSNIHSGNGSLSNTVITN